MTSKLIQQCSDVEARVGGNVGAFFHSLKLHFKSFLKLIKDYLLNELSKTVNNWIIQNRI
jgi:hypothetical protein